MPGAWFPIVWALPPLPRTEANIRIDWSGVIFILEKDEGGGRMSQRLPRTDPGEPMSLARRLRQLRHRTARWFLPPVRAAVTDAVEGVRESNTALPHGLKPPHALH